MNVAVKDKPTLDLTAVNGNAFALLGKAERAARAAGWSKDEWDAVFEEAISGDYGHLLRTLGSHFNVIIN